MHAVETMFSANSIVPWHKLGKIIPKEKRLSITEGIEAAGLMWDVKKLPLQVCTKQSMLDGGVSQDIADTFDGAFEQFVDKFATVRMTDKSVLGVVGKNYEILQNVKAFEFFQPFLDTGEVSLETGGSLFSGQKVWVLAKLNREPLDINGDKIEKYLVLSSGHDGLTSVRVQLTNVRIVCWNTWMLSLNSKTSQSIRIRHSSNMETNLKLIQESVNTIDNCFENSAEQYRKMQNKGISQSDLRRFMKIILKVDLDTPEKDLKTRTINRIEELMNLALNGKGNSGKTVFDAFNAVSEFTTHRYGRSEESRLDSVWFGAAQTMSQEAFDLAVQLSA